MANASHVIVGLMDSSIQDFSLPDTAFSLKERKFMPLLPSPILPGTAFSSPPCVSC